MIIRQISICVLLSLIICCGARIFPQNNKHNKLFYDSELRPLFKIVKDSLEKSEMMEWYTINNDTILLPTYVDAKFIGGIEAEKDFVFNLYSRYIDPSEHLFGGKKFINVLLDNGLNVVESRVLASPESLYRENIRNSFEQLDSVLIVIGNASGGKWELADSTMKEYHRGVIIQWFW